MAQTITIEVDDKRLDYLTKLQRVFGTDNVGDVFLAALEVADLLDTCDTENYRLFARRPGAPDRLVDIQRRPFKVRLVSTR